MPHSPRFLALVDAARAEITETDVEAVRQRMASGEPFALVDVREADEWDRGHLPGAVHVARGVLERDAESTFRDLDAPLVLYCGGGYRSALAAQSLGAMGYTRVESMDGGWRAWTEAGYDTEGGSSDGPDPASPGAR
ncbi:rhodanese-like domain-containing protein [Rubrivirga sp.]|uniref:rhodanese-like domain-containing protein n=1 Tax=Rubrivirga sp. TaxID=1885344 RepID=UPI003B52804E